MSMYNDARILRLGKTLFALGLCALMTSLFFTRVLPSFAGAPVEHVDNTYLFNEALYLNQSNASTDPAFKESDFELHGGKVKRVLPSPLPGEHTERLSVYDQSLIGPSLVGKEFSNKTPCWVFIPDGQGDAACGSSISMTYHKVGSLCSAKDPSYSQEVDIKATYTLRKCSHKENFKDKDPWKQYDGRAALHFTDNFSLGTWQAGIEDMQCDYQFLDSKTHQPIPLNKIYLTNTSLDRGEGFSIPSALVERFYLANNAPSKDDPIVHPQNRWNTLPGTLVYDKSGDYGRDLYTFIGSPVRHAAEGADHAADSVDTIGTPHYYWRSVCCLLNLKGTSTIPLHKISIGTREWTGTPEIPFDPFGWNNSGEMFSTTNFLPLTNARPAPPTKTVDKSEHVLLNDVLTYRITQALPSLGHNGLSRYQELSFVDQLPPELELVGVRFISDDQQELSQAGELVVHGQEIRYSLSSDTLENKLMFQGGTCALEIQARVKQQPEIGQRVSNKASVTINGNTQQTNEVEYLAEAPALSLDLRANTEYPSAPAVAEYEYLNHEKHSSCACIHYEGCLKNTNSNTQARGVAITEALPDSTQLIPDSLKVEGTPDCKVENHGNDFSITTAELNSETLLRFSYDALPNHTGVGSEIVHTAKAWARNIDNPKPGSEHCAVCDDAEVFINDPALKLEEWIEKSAIESPDYTKGEEFRVNDEITYHTRLSNVQEKSFARDITVVSEELPSDLELVDTVKLLPLVPSNFSRLTPGESDSIHNEHILAECNPSLKVIRNDKTWHWELHLDYLPAQIPCEVAWKLRASESCNGCEIEHGSLCSARNLPGQTIASQKTYAWINSPNITVSKTLIGANGENPLTAQYQAKLLPLSPVGTVARNLELSDVCKDPSYKLEPSSIKVQEKPSWLTLTPKDFTLQNNEWRLLLPKTSERPSYWTGTGHYFKWINGSFVEQAINNPLQAPESSSLVLQYQASLESNALGDHTIENVLHAHSQDGESEEASQKVSEKGARLSVEKRIDPFNTLDVGELCHARISIHNLLPHTQASELHVVDQLSDDSKQSGMSLVLSSIQLRDQQGAKVEAKNIQALSNESGATIGFGLDIPAPLSSDQVFVLEYDMKRQDAVRATGCTNEVEVCAQGVPTARDKVFIPFPEGIQSRLEISKTTPRDAYQAGDKISYTITLKNTGDKELDHLRIIDQVDNTELIPGTIELASIALNGEKLDPQDIHAHTSPAGDINGFEIFLKQKLEAQVECKLEYTYKTKPDIPQDLVLKNSAQADAARTGLARTEHEIALNKKRNLVAPTSKAVANNTTPGAQTPPSRKLAKMGDEVFESIPYLLASLALCGIGIVLVLSTFRKKKKEEGAQGLPWEKSSLRFDPSQQKSSAVRQHHVGTTREMDSIHRNETTPSGQRVTYEDPNHEVQGRVPAPYQNAAVQKNSKAQNLPWLEVDPIQNHGVYNTQDLSTRLPTINNESREMYDIDSTDGDIADTISTPMSENQYLNALRYI